MYIAMHRKRASVYVLRSVFFLAFMLFMTNFGELNKSTPRATSCNPMFDGRIWIGESFP